MQPYLLQRARTYPAPAPETFGRLLTTPLPDLFRRRYGPIPPIREVRGQDGEWGAPGQTRTVVLADGGTMLEELTAVDPPTSFGYRLSGVTGPMRPLVAEVDGAWSLEPAGTGVRVTWSWQITPASPVAARLLPVVGYFWRGYARQALESLEAILVPAGRGG